MLICSICSGAYPWHRPCDQSHPGVCHWCASLNMGGTPLDNPAHEAPPEGRPPPPPPHPLPPPVRAVLDAATAAALDAYAAHVQRTAAAGVRALRGADGEED